MKRRDFLRRLSPAALAVGLGLVACTRDPAAATTTAPRALRIAMVPNEDAAERHHDAYLALHPYLAPRLDVPVSIHAMENVSAAIDGPRAYFHTIGLNPERDFNRLLYGTDGALTLLAVKAGRLDLAAAPALLDPYRRLIGTVPGLELPV